MLLRLAADDVADAGFGHEVAFVAGIDEDAGIEGAAAFHLDGIDDAAGLGDAAVEVEPLAFDDGDVRQAGDPLVDHRLTDFGLKPIGGALVVGLANAGVELACEAADGELVAVVRGAEAAGGHAAEVLRGLDDGDGLAEARGFDGRGDAAGRAAVNDNVVIVGGGESGPKERGCGGYQNNKMCAHSIVSRAGRIVRR